MSEKSNLKPIAAALGAIFAISLTVSPGANAADNPFGMTELSKGGYMIVAGTAKHERDAETYIKQGDAKFHERDYEGALADWNRAIAFKPDYAKTYYKQGVALFYVAKFNAKSLWGRGGDYEGAIADFDRAIALKPDYAEAHYSRAVAKYFEGGFDGAIAIPDYDRAIELKPDYANAYYDRGHTRRDDPRGSIADYSRAIELKPDYVEAYYHRGRVKSRLDDYYGAIADFSRVIELDPRDDYFIDPHDANYN